MFNLTVFGYLIPLAVLVFYFSWCMCKNAGHDKAFIFLGVSAICSLLFYNLDSFFCNFGGDRWHLSQICFSLFFAFSFLQTGIIVLYKIKVFETETHYSAPVYLLASFLIFSEILFIIINIWNPIFYDYVVDWVVLKEGTGESAPLTVFKQKPHFSLIIFFLTLLVIIYEFLNIIRVVKKTFVTSTREILIAALSIFHYLFMILNFDRPHILVKELYLFSLFVPALYYFFVYLHKPVLVRELFRSGFFESTQTLCVIFNEDSVLVDFNDAAQKFFGFKRSDILSMTINDFILKRVPVGFMPVNHFYIEQFALTGPDGLNRIFNIEFYRRRYLNKISVCSYFFIFQDITKIVKKFDDIQLAASTDDMTGLLEHHVLYKKVKEINLYRKFPYTAVVCTPIIPQQFQDPLLTNKNLTLIHISDVVKRTVRTSDFAAYDNGMIIILFPADTQTAAEAMVRISQQVKQDNKLPFDFDFVYGIESRPDADSDMQKTINQAQIKMELNAAQK